jgi:hypothetical protein
MSIHAMKPFFKNYLFGKNCSMKSALTLMFFLLAIQPGFLVPSFLSSALAETRGIGKGILVAPVKLPVHTRAFLILPARIIPHVRSLKVSSL